MGGVGSILLLNCPGLLWSVNELSCFSVATKGAGQVLETDVASAPDKHLFLHLSH